MHQSSFDKMKSFRNRYLKGKETQPLVILDLGSTNIGGCYRQIFDSPHWQYQGLDLAPGDNVDTVLKEPYYWREIPSSSADILISGQTFEHIEFFWVTMAEIARVLKPGGLCCIVAPSGGHEHRYPVDCWRFYPDGFAALARYAKLDVLEAFTQWQEEPYTDCSNQWKDSVLIAQKPISSTPVRRKKVQKVTPASSASHPFKDYPLVQIVDEKDLPENCSFKKQLDLVGHHKQVVDFGCATGYFAQFLKQRSCKVVGVELNPDAAKMAESCCDQVLVADLDMVSIPELFGGQQFDVVVFGDVLEHLRDPWRVLREAHQILNPDGYVIASIPNIAHGAIRLALLQGEFEYSDMGILDNTHLRFFTRETVEDLFEKTGYLIELVDRTTMPIFTDNSLVPQIDRSDFNLETIQRIEADADSETLQFIVKAFPCSIEKQSALLQRRLQSTQGKLEESQTQLQQTQSQLHQIQAELGTTQTQLGTTQTHLHQTQLQLDHTQMELETAQTWILAMESSKFWKLRCIWIDFKRFLTKKVLGSSNSSASL
jgi:O-antigen biosynthesis protein